MARPIQTNWTLLQQLARLLWGNQVRQFFDLRYYQGLELSKGLAYGLHDNGGGVVIGNEHHPRHIGGIARHRLQLSPDPGGTEPMSMIDE